ncbi:MAG: Isonitrile hydratase [Luteibacter sp.]|uniref:DJ-1/PfpI family protein n=1 Tax=Luteibacter sp. TaxID=1886636 RepID=UPI00137F727E|nr:DJ-1/PfpI family protein [Luteibacter sp.]KAF1007230.1 MAG: Isonitrile hydratase [Luteibacter sp.]
MNDRDTVIDMDRRKALFGLGTAGIGMLMAPHLLAQNAPASPGKFDHPMPHLPDDGPRPRVAMVVHSNMIMLDLSGPMTLLQIAGFDLDLVGKSLSPMTTDIGLPVTPGHAFADYKATPDVLFVPGGLMGTLAAMADEETLDFLADQGKQVKWVTSVCTGSLLLGAAGLLRGYRATGHWGVRDLLPRLGATVVNERVVIDRNRMTGGGATAGLDFALVLADKLKGRKVAERAELILEYAPAPPFNVGNPELAGPERMKEARARRVYMDAMAAKSVEAARTRLRI